MNNGNKLLIHFSELFSGMESSGPAAADSEIGQRKITDLDGRWIGNVVVVPADSGATSVYTARRWLMLNEAFTRPTCCGETVGTPPAKGVWVCGVCRTMWV